MEKSSLKESKMINIIEYDVFGMAYAIEGMRNPMNSWDKSDSNFIWEDRTYLLGKNDETLAKRLINAGEDHRKFMRMIHVQATVNAPLYWWKEYDTYKVGTVANSCSTMHTIHKSPFSLEDFSHEYLSDGEYGNKELLNCIITCLNVAREKFIETKDRNHWYQMIQLLPSSYNQMRTIDLNYEVLFKMYHARKNHKLDEWREFCEWIEYLPSMDKFLGLEVEE